MVNLILKFVSCCRAADHHVSSSEVLDCLRHLAIIDLLDEEQFRAVLRSNFAKSRREQASFDRLYDLFFHKMITDPALLMENDAGEKLQDIFDELRDEDIEDARYDAAIEFLEGDPAAYLELLKKINDQDKKGQGPIKSNLAPLSNRLGVMLQFNKIKNKMVKFDGGNHREYLEDRLKEAQAMLSKEPKPHNDSLKRVKRFEKKMAKLGETSFSSLTPKEIEEMRDVTNHLVRRLKDVAGRRYRSKTKGVLDVKKTIRSAAAFQGIPLEIKYKYKPPKKGKIVTLCDISGSVWSTARFMLNMLYSVQDCFSTVRSFAFISGIIDVTDTFEKNEINKAIELIMNDEAINYQAMTDYGETLRNFRDDYMYTLNKKTTLIIVGDGRSNYMNPEEGALEEMRTKCRRVIWLTPEEERFWLDGDCEMNTYKAYCHEVRTVNCLNQLADFIEGLVL